MSSEKVVDNLHRCKIKRSRMSFELDWPVLSGVISRKLQSIITEIPPNMNPMLASPITLKRLSLGDDPPQIAITHITSLHLNEQTVGAVVRYHGNAEMEVTMDLDVNVFGATKQMMEMNRFLGNLYCDAPMRTRCRFLISAIRITVKVEVSHGAQSYIRFEEPPEIAFCIDSNMCLLGPIFDSALQRVMKIIRTEFARLPEKILIELPSQE